MTDALTSSSTKSPGDRTQNPYRLSDARCFGSITKLDEGKGWAVGGRKKRPRQTRAHRRIDSIR